MTAPTNRTQEKGHCQFPEVGLKRPETSISCLLEHLLLEPEVSWKKFDFPAGENTWRCLPRTTGDKGVMSPEKPSLPAKAAGI